MVAREKRAEVERRQSFQQMVWLLTQRVDLAYAPYTEEDRDWIAWQLALAHDLVHP